MDQSKNQEEEQHLLAEFIHLFIKMLKEEVSNDEDPFESYAHQLRLRIFEQVPEVENRFVNGHKLLAELIESGR